MIGGCGFSEESVELLRFLSFVRWFALRNLLSYKNCIGIINIVVFQLYLIECCLSDRDTYSNLAYIVGGCSLFFWVCPNYSFWLLLCEYIYIWRHSLGFVRYVQLWLIFWVTITGKGRSSLTHLPNRLATRDSVADLCGLHKVNLKTMNTHARISFNRKRAARCDHVFRLLIIILLPEDTLRHLLINACGVPFEFVRNKFGDWSSIFE